MLYNSSTPNPVPQLPTIPHIEQAKKHDRTRPDTEWATLPVAALTGSARQEEDAVHYAWRINSRYAIVKQYVISDARKTVDRIPCRQR